MCQACGDEKKFGEVVLCESKRQADPHALCLSCFPEFVRTVLGEQKSVFPCPVADCRTPWNVEAVRGAIQASVDAARAEGRADDAKASSFALVFRHAFRSSWLPQASVVVSRRCTGMHV
jgi:hypothetical protein